jgi:hypothetical protein
VQPDLLQQLRDLHLPTDPSWWPPAPGWWLLAALMIAAVVVAIRKLQQVQVQRRPFRQARALYAALYAEFQAGNIDDRDYLNRSNELLKRLVIFGIGENRARQANDVEWLALLDTLAGSQAFTGGAGAPLGNQRFSSSPEADIEALHRLLDNFFANAKP